MMCNNPNLDLINIDAKFNAYTKFNDLLSIYSQDIEWKRNFDIHTEPGTTQIQYFFILCPALFVWFDSLRPINNLSVI